MNSRDNHSIVHTEGMRFMGSDVDEEGFMAKTVLESVVEIFMEEERLIVSMEIGREGSIDGAKEESMMMDIMDVVKIFEEEDAVCTEILGITTRIFLKKGSVNSVK